MDQLNENETVDERLALLLSHACELRSEMSSTPQPDDQIQEMIERVDPTDWVTKMTTATRLMSEALNEFAFQLGERIGAMIKDIDQILLQYYQSIGSPSGKGRRGFRKWLKSFAEEENGSTERK